MIRQMNDKEQSECAVKVFLVLGVLALLSGCAWGRTNLQHCATACRSGALDNFHDEEISCECKEGVLNEGRE